MVGALHKSRNEPPKEIHRTMPVSASTHVWEKVEITLTSERSYANPYTEVEVWVDLKGPGFAKRCYGFWDGGNTFRVRVMAIAAGEWSWVSGSNQPDAGLNGKTGGFAASEWSEAEKQANPTRRGLLRATPNGHALQYPDGTPCFLLGDTWWATPTFRFKWYDDDRERPIGADMGFKDMVRYRKAQGYNCIAMLAALPNWANDGLPPTIRMDDGIVIRAAWPQAGTQSAKDMHNEGGRPFLFPGRVPGYENVYPDMERINPAYFAHMDKKIDYLNSQGFIPFIEVSRRDASTPWKKYYPWPDSYARYIQYVWTRYQANNTILSPIHFDSGHQSILSKDYNVPANIVWRKGVPAFGTLGSCNASGSSLVNFGNSDEAPWLTLHQIGNRRWHNSHWLLTEIYHESKPAKPALNGEPYYPGFPPPTWTGRAGPLPPGAAPTDSPEAELYNRSGMYGSVLSGGFAGHIYGCAGLWSGSVEPEAAHRVWEALEFRSGAEMAYLPRFVMSEGLRYRDLVPNADLVEPNKTREIKGNRGWAYCARTPDRSLFMLYFEADCPAQAQVRGALFQAKYRAQWFDPRTGQWSDAGVLSSNDLSEIALPPLPSTDDWALKLVLER